MREEAEGARPARPIDAAPARAIPIPTGEHDLVTASNGCVSCSACGLVFSPGEVVGHSDPPECLWRHWKAGEPQTFSYTQQARIGSAPLRVTSSTPGGPLKRLFKRWLNHA